MEFGAELKHELAAVHDYDPQLLQRFQFLMQKIFLALHFIFYKNKKVDCN